MTRTILITGTSSGYGKAMADLFLARGWNVLATMRRPDPSVFSETSPRLKLLPLDVTRPDSIAEAIGAGVEAFGGIDVWVNNAGIGLASIIEATPEHIFREVFETNTFGVIGACRAIIPQMRKQKQGIIINVTSSITLGVMPLVAIYAASKCAVEGFTEALSYEIADFNVKARLVEPGYAPTTKFADNVRGRMQDLLPADYGPVIESFLTRMADYPTRHCTEAEVAEAVFAAATEEGDRLRYLAGADSELFAGLRWSTSEEHYLASMREMFAPASARAV